MIERSADGLCVKGPMLIADARALLETGRGFLRADSGKSELVFDLSSVEETDSSALSVIFGLLRTAQACGVKMRITHPPSSMISLASLYGVSESLPLA